MTWTLFLNIFLLVSEFVYHCTSLRWTKHFSVPTSNKFAMVLCVSQDNYLTAGCIQAFAQFVFSATRRRGYFGSNFSRLVTETPCHDFILSRCVVVGIPCSTPRLALYNIGWSRMNDNRVFRCVWCHPLLLVTEINVAEYGLCCKQREVLVDKSHRNSREIIPWRSSPTVSIFRHIYFCHERTTMTSETAENTIFVRFHFTLCYLMLTQLLGYQPQKLDSVWILRASFIIVIRA